MSLDFLSKAQIRRHLGIPFAATPLGNVTMGIRTVTRAGQLELYMNVLAPEEEAILLGQPYGLIQLYGPWSAGDVLSVSLSSFVTPSVSGTMTYTVQTSDTTAKYPWLTIATNMAQRLLALNSSIGLSVISASGVPTDPMNPPVSSPPFGQITLRSPVQFNVSVSGNGLTLLADGTVYPSPVYTTTDSSGNAVVYYGLLPICNALESDLINTSPQIAFDVAGGTATGQVVFRKEALRQHLQLYRFYTRQMGVSLGFYPAYGASGGSRSFGVVI
jgi:hypothetical protein